MYTQCIYTHHPWLSTLSHTFFHFISRPCGPKATRLPIPGPGNRCKSLYGSILIDFHPFMGGPVSHTQHPKSRYLGAGSLQHPTGRVPPGGAKTQDAMDSRPGDRLESSSPVKRLARTSHTREAGAPVSRPSYQVGTVYPCPALARPTLSRFGNRRSGLSAFLDQSENYAG